MYGLGHERARLFQGLSGRFVVLFPSSFWLLVHQTRLCRHLVVGVVLLAFLRVALVAPGLLARGVAVSLVVGSSAASFFPRPVCCSMAVAGMQYLQDEVRVGFR